MKRFSNTELLLLFANSPSEKIQNETKFIEIGDSLPGNKKVLFTRTGLKTQFILIYDINGNSSPTFNNGNGQAK